MVDVAPGFHDRYLEWYVTSYCPNAEVAAQEESVQLRGKTLVDIADHLRLKTIV